MKKRKDGKLNTTKKMKLLNKQPAETIYVVKGKQTRIKRPKQPTEDYYNENKELNKVLNNLSKNEHVDDY